MLLVAYCYFVFVLRVFLLAPTAFTWLLLLYWLFFAGVPCVLTILPVILLTPGPFLFSYMLMFRKEFSLKVACKGEDYRTICASNYAYACQVEPLTRCVDVALYLQGPLEIRKSLKVM